MSKDGFDLEAFLALKKEAERLRRDADRAEGRLASLLARLQEEFGLASVEKSDRELVVLGIKVAEDGKEYGRLLAEFEQANGERLSG